MKLLLISILIAALSTRQIEAHQSQNFSGSGLNDKLIKLLERFKEILRNGNETLGLPIMDPLILDHQNLSMNSEILSGDVKVENFKLFGLSYYNIQKADLKIVGLKLILGLQWSGLSATIQNYDIEGVALKFVDVYGKGSLKVNLDNLNFTTTVSISIKKPKNTLFIKEMMTDVSLEDFQLKIDGLFNDNDLSDMTNAIVSDLVPSAIKTYQKKFTEKINKVIMTNANKILSTMTLKDLLAIISA